MKYFEGFPNLLYTFDDPSLNNFEQVVDIFTRVRMMDSIINNVSVYYTYDVKDSDSIDGIASKYYNDPDRHWIILFTNQIIDPYWQWPLNQDELEQWLTDTYGSVANSQIILDHVEKQTFVTVTQFQSSNTQQYISLVPNTVVSLDGSTYLPNIANPIIQVGANNIVSFSDGSRVDTSVLLVAVSAYEQAINNNESNRTIKLIQPGYVQQIESELQNLLSQ